MNIQQNPKAVSRIEQAREYFQQFKSSVSDDQLNRIKGRYWLPLRACGCTINKKWAGAMVGLAHAAEYELVARECWDIK